MNQRGRGVARAASHGRRRGGRSSSAAAEPAGNGTAQPKPSIYWFLTMWLSVQSVTYMAIYKHVARFMFRLTDDPPSQWQIYVVLAHIVGLAGAMLITYALENLHYSRMQHTFKADMLRLALMLYAASVAIYMMVAPYEVEAFAELWLLIISQFVFAVPYIDLFGSWEDCARTWRHIRHLATLVVSQLRLRHLPAALYFLLAVAFAATGLFCVVAHEAMMLHVFCNVYGVRRTMAMENVIGAFLSGLASITWQLKGQAQKNQLAHPLPRIVNRALMAASVGHLLALAPPLMQRKGGWMLASFVANWGLALLACVVGMAAPAAGAPAAAAPAAAAPAGQIGEAAQA